MNNQIENFAQAWDANGEPAPIAGWGTAQNVDGSAASAQSTVIDATAPCVVRIAAVSGNLYIKIGTNPTAAADDSTYLPALAFDHVKLATGDKIAVLGGVANITKCC